VEFSALGKFRKGNAMKNPLKMEPIQIPETKEDLEKAVERFEKITKERPLLNAALTVLFLLPILNLLTRLILALPIDPWQYAEAFVMVLPIVALWAGFILARCLRTDFLCLAKQNAALMAEIAARNGKKG